MFELYLHDFGNLSCQLIQICENKNTLEEIADRLNYIFATAGRSKQFEAQVVEAKEEEYFIEEEYCG